MADSLNTTPAPDFDLETAILDLYGAIKCLMLFTGVTFPNNDKRDQGFRVFHLNDEQFTALFYLLYAVNGHVHDLRNGAGFGDDPTLIGGGRHA